jgi:hypothetical protein
MKSPMSEIRHRMHLSHVREIAAHSFVTPEGTAFSLVNGMLVGTSKGAKRGYSIPLSEILLVYAQTADSQQRARIVKIFSKAA